MGKPDNIIRYGISRCEAGLGYSNGLVHEADGGFVTYEDYAALRAELAEAKATISHQESIIEAYEEIAGPKQLTPLRKQMEKRRQALKGQSTCRKCGGEMRPGKALAQTFTAAEPDLPDSNVVTLKAGGSGKQIDVMKCSECGWSVTDE
jgi:transcription elongation factor Elf1